MDQKAICSKCVGVDNSPTMQAGQTLQTRTAVLSHYLLVPLHVLQSSLNRAICGLMLACCSAGGAINKRDSTRLVRRSRSLAVRS